jgi:hypothetical protein
MSAFTFIRKMFGALPDIAWFAKLGSQFLGSAVSGHDVADDAHAAVKGISGIFGFKDERQMLVKFDRLERRIPGATTVVLDFLEDHYSTDLPRLTPAGKAYILRQKRLFRAVVVDMGDTDGKIEKIGKETFKFDGKDATSGATISINRERDIHSDHKDNSVDLLERLYHILCKPGTADERKAACVKYLKTSDVPIVDRRIVKIINIQYRRTLRKAKAAGPEVKRYAREGYRAAEVEAGRLADNLEQVNLRRTANQSRWQRFCNKIFPF